MDHHLIYLFHRWSHGYAQQWRIQHSNRNMENQKNPITQTWSGKSPSGK